MKNRLNESGVAQPAVVAVRGRFVKLIEIWL